MLSRKGHQGLVMDRRPTSLPFPHQSLVTLSRKHSIVRQLTDDGSHHLPAHVPEKFHSQENVKANNKLTKQTTIGDLENIHLNPKVEGRIRVLTGRIREELKNKKEL